MDATATPISTWLSDRTEPAEGEHVFAIVDGASVPQVVHNWHPDDRTHWCLFRGDLSADELVYAPHLVQLVPGHPLLSWILAEGAGTHWGVFALTRCSHHQLRKHLRTILRVRLPDEDTALFRFFDPRVLAQISLAATPADAQRIFGPIRRFLGEYNNGESYREYARSGEGIAIRMVPDASGLYPGDDWADLEPSISHVGPIDDPLHAISRPLWDALCAASERDFQRRLVASIETSLPISPAVKEVGGDLPSEVARRVGYARQGGIQAEADIARFIEATWHLPFGKEGPASEPIRRVLSEASLEGWQKVDQIWRLVFGEDHPEVES